MRSFLTLVGFEYKKIRKQKSAIIALAFVSVMMCFGPLAALTGNSYIGGELFESHFQAIYKDRAHSLALSGRAIDETLLMETKDAYAKIPDVERYAATTEYQNFARPYREIFLLLDAVYGVQYGDLRDVSEADIHNFYQTRHDGIELVISAMNIGKSAKDKLIQLDSEIETPFVFTYIGAYDALIGNIYAMGIVCAFALAICLAPMFAGEYSTRADQLILSSKMGKGRLILAKLFTAVSLSTVFFLLMLILSYIVCSLAYGIDRPDAPFQLLIPYVAYPLTILEATLVFGICTFFGTLLTGSITLLLSAKCKSPFGVIIIISVLLFVPTVIHVPNSKVLLHHLFSLLPSNMAAIWAVFSHVPYNFFGLIVLPYVFLPIFAFLASAIILPFAWRGFRNHQIG